MHAFKDTEGRGWEIRIDVTAVKRVKGLLAVDLLALAGDRFKSLAELISDLCRLADVLYCLVKPQADQRGVSDEDFGRGLAGDVIEHAADAFVEELVDFFPSARGRRSLRKALAAGKEAAGILQERQEREMDKIDPAALAQTFIDSAGNSPASPASTPAPSPSPS